MTREEIISGLKFTVEMFLFDPTTGEKYTEPRNDMDKTTIDACRGAIELLEQEPSGDAVSRQMVKEQMIKYGFHAPDMTVTEFVEDLPSVKQKPICPSHGVDCEDCPAYEPNEDAISRDFQIGDEVRMIGSDPIYDDCDVGWVIRNASEQIKTMYVMRNDGSADEECKAEWYKTGRHNAMLAEAIKALPSVNPQPKTGHWECNELFYDGESRGAIITCSECGNEFKVSPKVFENLYSNERFCNHCGAKMESEDKE